MGNRRRGSKKARRLLNGHNGRGLHEPRIPAYVSVMRALPAFLLGICLPVCMAQVIVSPAGPETGTREDKPWTDAGILTKPASGLSAGKIELLKAAAASDDTAALLQLASIAASSMDAFAYVRRAAELGDHAAELELASMYADGRGVPKDIEKANVWGRKAAAGGNAKAQFSLGATLLASQGDPPCRDEGIRWLESSARLGNGRAAVLLSAVYVQGAFGLPVDEAKAEAVLMPFAEKDDAGCQFALASIYQFSKLHEADRSPARVWLKRAQANGHPEAAKVLKDLAAPSPGPGQTPP